jgi:hypothetical protein
MAETSREEAVSRRASRERAVSTLQEDAVATARSGAQRVVEGGRDLRTAERLGTGATVVGAAGVHDLTRADDMALVAQRMGSLGKIVGQAGAQDVAEGIELLAASDDIEGMSSLVGLLSMGDLERGMQLARLSGELQVAGRIVTRLQMPVLAAFLGSRGDQLSQAAIEQVVRSAATRVLSAAMQVTGGQIRELSAGEIAEGVVRLAAADAMSERADDLVADAAQRHVRGRGELETAAAFGSAAREMAREGVAKVAEGGVAIGAAVAEAAVADAVADAGKSEGSN